jgi:ribonuclease P protein component
MTPLLRLKCMARNVFPKRFRLTRRAEFDEVFNHGVKTVDGALVVHVMPNGLGWSRIGIVVGRRVKDSPTRNRLKRLLREAFRTGRAGMPAGIDVVVIPRRGRKLDFEAVRRSLAALVGRDASGSAVAEVPGKPR